MKIYTKTGDDGTTGLFGGDRVSKVDARVEAYGTVDEINAALGMVRAHKALSSAFDELIATLQNDLFVIGAELACAPGKKEKLTMKWVDTLAIERIEHAIDEAEAGLSPLQNFVLPGGSPAAASLHLARTIARRAERRVLGVTQPEPPRLEVVMYLNRLSDLLFVLARRANHEAGIADVPWIAKT